MSAHPPPVPKEQQSPMGGAPGAPKSGGEAAAQQDRNLAEQDRQGNTKQNTTNKGYQQDR